MFKNPEILERLESVEQRLARIESRLEQMADNDQLRAELRAAQERADALARQGLHVVDLLAMARKEIRELESGGGA